MSIQRTHKQSDLEKRLKLLNMQLHGKKEEKSSAISHSPRFAGEAGQSSDKQQNVILGRNVMTTPESNMSDSGPFNGIQGEQARMTTISDIIYLRQDLFKIFILSTIAIAAQFLLFFSSRYGFLRIF